MAIYTHEEGTCQEGTCVWRLVVLCSCCRVCCVPRFSCTAASQRCHTRAHVCASARKGTACLLPVTAASDTRMLDRAGRSMLNHCDEAKSSWEKILKDLGVDPGDDARPSGHGHPVAAIGVPGKKPWGRTGACVQACAHVCVMSVQKCIHRCT